MFDRAVQELAGLVGPVWADGDEWVAAEGMRVARVRAALTVLLGLFGA